MLTSIILQFIRNNVLLFEVPYNLAKFKPRTSLVYKTRFVIDSKLAHEMEIAGCIHRRNWKGSRVRWSVEEISSLSVSPSRYLLDFPQNSKARGEIFTISTISFAKSNCR